MNLLAYQTKQVLARYGIPTLPGRVAESPEQAAEAFRALGGGVAVVKAQIHAGGRGKGGGVKLVRGADEARDVALKLLGKSLVTPQTGPQGRVVRKVLVESGCDIGRELYLGCVLDRKLGLPVLMASKQGGMEIEEVAARDPEAILKQPFDVGYGLQGFQARALAFGLGLEGDTFKAFVAMAGAVARMFVERDCSLLEINPLVITKQGTIVALDG